VKTNIRVSRKKPESLTSQIREQLHSLIDSGAWAAGTLLPSERDLANNLKVARNVVRGAYESLVKAGKVKSEGRRGRRVQSAGARKKTTKTARKK
jgi:DNA-binding GntR family transcriptional regulator